MKLCKPSFAMGCCRSGLAALLNSEFRLGFFGICWLEAGLFHDCNDGGELKDG